MTALTNTTGPHSRAIAIASLCGWADALGPLALEAVGEVVLAGADSLDRVVAN